MRRAPASFVRFVFSLSSSEERWRPRLREIFAVRSAEGIAQVVAPFVERGELEPERPITSCG